jgi:hypothetical protein
MRSISHRHFRVFRTRLASLALALTVFSSCLPAWSQSVTLTNFGYQNKKINGKLALGSRPLVVILVNFAGEPPLTNPPSFFADLIFNAARVPSFNGYFQAVSNGRFSFSNAGIIGPLSLPASQNEAGFAYKDTPYCSNIVYQAMVYAKASGTFNFESYDANNDGHITPDELSILIMNEDTVWGLRYGGSVKPPGFTKDWTGGLSVLTPQAPFVVMVEETEESLGMIDIYSAECLSFGLSPQSCFDGTAPWTNSYYLDPWHRLQIGWSEPRIRSLTAGGIETISANQLSDPTSPIILYDPVHGTNEFFILEYRTQNSPAGSGYDANVVANGLAVWHIQQDSNHNPTSVASLTTTNLDVVVWNEGPPAFQRGASTLWGSGVVTTNLSWLSGQTQTHLHVLPFNLGSGSITIEWLSAVDTWVDFNGSAPFQGTLAQPYKTLADGVTFGSYGGTLHIKTGTSPEKPTLSKPMTFKGYNGPATIGH